jgi:hypothetical protein
LAGALNISPEERGDTELCLQGSTSSGTTVVCHDHVETMQRRNPNVFIKEYVIVCTMP